MNELVLIYGLVHLLGVAFIIGHGLAKEASPYVDTDWKFWAVQIPIGLLLGPFAVAVVVGYKYAGGE